MSESIEPKTLIYKTADNIDIALDVYLPKNAKSVPVLLWFHGGGLLQGRRDSIAPHLTASVEKYGQAVLSADYRLAPQASIKDICQDVLDCVTYVQSPNGLSKQLANDQIDTKRLAVSGSSAGGYLALLAGLYCEVKPSVILAIYPITDPLGYFFTNSQPFPLFKPPGAVDTEKKVAVEDIAQYLDPKSKMVPNCPRESKRSNMYYNMLKQANLAQLLGLSTGASAYNDSENDRWRIAKALSPRSLPPTYIVHGDVDRAVGVEQSDEVVGVMIGLGLTVQYDRVKGKDHIFDAAPDVEMENMYRFMHKHLAESKL